ncbi:MAG: AAA family ATPase, partial [Candidatus Methanomethylophilus sp.]|nr:AAA family ATPase [Methanomethylophilus sp.]
MSARIFKRKIYQRLLQWKAENDGKSALLIEGARRVGKSTIVEEFAKNEYDSYLLIDFNQPRQGTIELFERYSHDIGLLTSNLSILYDVELKQRKSLVIFDEIQNYPKARALIKYLVADGRYDYIETGSLISLKENVKDITIPSEEEPVQMYPMDFEEWLWANGNENTMDLIREHFQTLEP